MRKLLLSTTATLVIFLLAVGLISAQTVSDTVRIDAPPNEAVLSGGSVEIIVSFNAPDSHPVSQVQVFLNGKYITERRFESPLARGSSTFKWDTVRTPNGRYQLAIQVFSGEVYLGMASCQVKVANNAPDLTLPRVAILSPEDGAVVSGTTAILIDASVSSGADPIVTVYGGKSFRAMKNRSPYTYEWNTTLEENGPHDIRVMAVDTAGNRTELAPIRVIVQNAASPMASESPASPSVEVTSVPDASASSNVVARDPGQSLSEHARTSPAMTDTPVERVGIERVSAPTQSVSSARAEMPSTSDTSASAVEAPVQSPRVSPSESDVYPVLVASLAETEPMAVAGKVMALAPRVVIDSQAYEVSVVVPKSMYAGFEYTVEPGDRIFSLAKKFGVSVQDIIDRNELENPHLIRIGDKLYIPSPMVSLRPVFENAGGTITWNSEEREVRAVCSRNDVRLRPGSAEVTVNNRLVMMESPAELRSGRTLAPKSFVAGELGMDTETGY